MTSGRVTHANVSPGPTRTPPQGHPHARTLRRVMYGVSPLTPCRTGGEGAHRRAPTGHATVHGHPDSRAGQPDRRRAGRDRAGRGRGQVTTRGGALRRARGSDRRSPPLCFSLAGAARPSPSPLPPSAPHRRAEAEHKDLLGVLHIVDLEGMGGERERVRQESRARPPAIGVFLPCSRALSHASGAHNIPRTFCSFSWISDLGTLGRPGCRTSTI